MTLFLSLVAALAILVTYGYLRPNAARLDPALGLESWSVVSDGTHNSNTDLVHWRDHFYLVHATSPWHFASDKCRVVVKRSRDARRWETVAEFRNPGGDIRDPKFAVIRDRLFLYVLLNQTFDPLPHATRYTASEDGIRWPPLAPLEPDGWLFWRPRSPDGETWYVPAYAPGQDRVDLLVSGDGSRWTRVSRIHDGETCSETDLVVLPGGRMVATVRLEASGNWWLGDANGATLIAVADPPYTTWRRARSLVTRLDGPCLFVHQGEVFAVGRRHPAPRRGFPATGSIFGRKRTALYRVTPSGLLHLSDLPSAGDTAYAGVALHDRHAYVSYYTSAIGRDWPWLLGMLGPSEIRVARVPLAKLLERVPRVRLGEPARSPAPAE